MARAASTGALLLLLGSVAGALAAGCGPREPPVVIGVSTGAPKRIPPPAAAPALADAAATPAHALCRALCASAPSLWRSSAHAMPLPPDLAPGIPRHVAVLVFLSPISAGSFAQLTSALALASRAAAGRPDDALPVDVVVAIEPAARGVPLEDNPLYERVPPAARRLIVHDAAHRMAVRMGTYRFPETWLVDRRGRVRGRFDGDRDLEDEAVLALLAELAAGHDCDVFIDPSFPHDGLPRRPHITGPDEPLCAPAYPRSPADIPRSSDEP